jgi:HEPN domain-containing protein
MSGPDPADVWRKVLDWLRIAASDRRAARVCIVQDPPLRDIAAYHCQQAAEKLLKALLVYARQDFGKTHDLETLANAVARVFPDVGPLVAPMDAWSAWGVAYRYPSEQDQEPEPSVDDLLEALERLRRLEAALLSHCPER